MEYKLYYCTNTPGLFTFFGLSHNSLDSYRRGLKAVLLHNDNKYPSIPIVNTVHLKESYDNMELLLEIIKWSSYVYEGEIHKVLLFSLSLG